MKFLEELLQKFSEDPRSQIVNENFISAMPKKEEKDIYSYTEKLPKEAIEPLPFYPNNDYIKYNRAPEKTLTTAAVAAIAAARKRAEETGVLTPELGEHLLPMAMVEGENDRIGIIPGRENFYASRRMLKALENMGLEEGKDYISNYHNGEKHVRIMNANPAMAAVILGEKAQLKRVGGDLEKAIKAYNGKGKGTERFITGDIPADVDVYWDKVQKAKQTLDHPLNYKIKNHYTKAYQK